MSAVRNKTQAAHHAPDEPVEAALASSRPRRWWSWAARTRISRTRPRWIAGQVHGTILMIEGAGHYPKVEAPEQFGPQVIRFLRGADAA
jgi:pimeloyl-ACP methyl ester carboxylesterase